MEQDCLPLAASYSYLDSRLIRVTRAAAWRFQALAARNFTPGTGTNPEWESACKGLLPFLGSRREDLLELVGKQLDGAAFDLFRKAVAKLIDSRPVLVPVGDAMVAHDEFLLAIPMVVESQEGVPVPLPTVSPETADHLARALRSSLKLPGNAKVSVATWCIGLEQTQHLTDCERFYLLQHVLDDNKPEQVDSFAVGGYGGVGCLVLIGILVEAGHRASRAVADTCKKRQREIERILRRRLWGDGKPFRVRIGPCSGYTRATAQGVVEDIVCSAIERTRMGLPSEVCLSASAMTSYYVMILADYPGDARASHCIDSIYALTVLRRLWRGLTERGITVRFDGELVTGKV